MCVCFVVCARTAGVHVQSSQVGRGSSTLLL